MRWSGLQFYLISMHLILVLLCAPLTVDAKPSLRAAVLSRPSWIPSWSSLTSGMATFTSYLPSLSSSPSLGPPQSPLLTDLSAYLWDTMPAFSDIYASIPSWDQWQGILPDIPSPSDVFGQLPTKVQSSLQQIWSHLNPLDIEQFRRRQYRRGVFFMLGLAGFYNSYQEMYKQHRKGIEAYVEPHQRKNKFNEMKRVCYYELPQKEAEDSLEPSKIRSGLCSHIIVSHAKVSEHGNVVLPMDQDEDGHLEQMMGALKKAAPSVLLSVSGRSQKKYFSMAEVKHQRLRFIRSSVGIARRYGLAGIDLDWEFSAVDSGNPRDVDNMVTLVREFEDYMEPWLKGDKQEKDSKKFLLTATVSALPRIISKSYDVKRLSKHLDWVNVMAYDYGVKRDGFSMLEHNAPLFGYSKKSSGLNVAFSGMMWSQQGMPHEKIIIGLPLYGRSYLVKQQSQELIREAFPPRHIDQLLRTSEQLEASTIQEDITDSSRQAEILGENDLWQAPTRETLDTDFPTVPIQDSSTLVNTISFYNPIGALQTSSKNQTNSFLVPTNGIYGSEEHKRNVLGRALWYTRSEVRTRGLEDRTFSSTRATLSATENPLMIIEGGFKSPLYFGVLSAGPGMRRGFIPYSEICAMVSNGTLRVEMDSAAQVPFATDGRNWVSFDNIVSASRKSRWVEDMGFGGVALYNLNMDDWKGDCDPNKTPFSMLRAVWKMLG